MSYIEWWWYVFFDETKPSYGPFKSALCRLIMPCLPEWGENFQHEADNDNRPV